MSAVLNIIFEFLLIWFHSLSIILKKNSARRIWIPEDIPVSDIIFSIFPNENFVDLSLYQFGWERCEPSHTFGPAARNHYLFHYVISGTGMLYADDTSGHTHIYQIKSGQGFMIFPNQINTYIADKDLPWEYTWVEFDGLRVREALSITGLSHDAPVYHARSHDMRETMMQEMLYIARHGDMPPFHLIGPLVPLPGCPDPLCLSHGPLHLQGRETPGLLYT